MGKDQVSLTTTRSCQIMVQVCRALDYCHSRSPAVIHCDVKPKNIMLQSHNEAVRCKLIDFGLAQLATKSQRPALGGSWAYRAPETYRAPLTPAHPTMDVFAFGRLCHVVITRTRRPFATPGVDEDEM